MGTLCAWTDVRTVFQRASEQLERTVASVDRSSMESQTPSEVSIRELVEQVLAGNECAVRLLSGATAVEARAGLRGLRLGEDALQLQQVSASCTGELIVHGWGPLPS